MISSFMQHNEYLKVIAGEANMTTVELLQVAYIFSFISDNLKEWGRNFKEQHERMNKVSR